MSFISNVKAAFLAILETVVLLNSFVENELPLLGFFGD